MLAVVLVGALTGHPRTAFAQAGGLATTPSAPASLSGFGPGNGHLEPAGRYLAPPHGSAPVYLDNGIVFSYGFGAAVSEWKSQAAQGRWLRRRLEDGGVGRGPDTGPKWFDPGLRGWHRLPAAPQCPEGMRYLHTSTPTADGKLLIAGGLCDAPKMADDHTPYPAYAALSLWDTASHAWLPAGSLAQPRIFHSATAMADGSVLLVGGESDPARAASPSEPVLASVERVGDGKTTAMAPLAVARAKHSATALPGARLLVAGGFDASGRAIASAELFDAASGTWQAVAPLHVARHSHTATLLDDGRVLVAGGIGADGKMLDATEIWDTAQGKWTAGPELPIALYGHAAAKLASGQVLVAGGGWLAGAGKAIPWAWTWDPKDEEWELAGLATPATETEMASPVALFAQADGSALVFTSNAILRWVPAGQSAREAQAGRRYMPGDLALAPPAPVASAAPVRAAVAPPPRELAWREHAVDTLEDHKWIVLALAIAGIGFALLRRLRARPPHTDERLG